MKREATEIKNNKNSRNASYDGTYQIQYDKKKLELLYICNFEKKIIAFDNKNNQYNY